MSCGLHIRGLGLAATLAGVLALGGCGGIEFKGKVFDYAGLSGDGSKQDVRMSERAPLVLPPNLHTLPEPGTSPAVASAREDWPTDPERARKSVVAQKEAKEQKAAQEADPTNPYAGKPTLLDKLFSRKKTDEEVIADVPEPDPSDKTAQDRAREQPAMASAAPKPLTPQADAPPPQDDPFHPAAPDSYNKMSNPSGNQAGY
jgi:hypothetical protein